MSLRVADVPGLRARLVQQFGWRRIARYHLGLELLRCWKQADAAVKSLRMQQRLDSLARFALEHKLHRKARWMGGYDAAITLVLVGASSATLLPKHQSVLVHPAAAQTSIATEPFTTRIMTQDVALLAQPALVSTASVPLPEGDGAASRLKREYAFARERCLARLRETVAFQQLEAETGALQLQVESLRRDDPGSQLPDTSLRWMRSKSQLNGMMQAALKLDLDVQKAESAMRAGGLIQPTFPIRSPEVNEPDPRANQAAAGL